MGRFTVGGKYFESHVPAGIGPFVVLLGHVRGSSRELGFQGRHDAGVLGAYRGSVGLPEDGADQRGNPRPRGLRDTGEQDGPTDTRSAAALRVSVISSALDLLSGRACGPQRGTR